VSGLWTRAEMAAASLVAGLVAAVLAAYLLDRLGVRIAPVLVLLVAVACSAATMVWWRRALLGARAPRGDLAPFAAVVLGVLAALFWLGSPELLPPGSGSDLTHHLQLIDFIDRYGRLPHTAADAALVGNMINYTPGSHVLASMAGAWVRSDGLHAVFPVVALLVAIKAGLLFLIVGRLVGPRFRVPAAMGSVLLLFLPYDYFIGSFVRFSFLAQVMSETFAVAMWLALVLWDEHPSLRAAALFAIAGVGVFLTWPVWIGPPVLVLLALSAFGGDSSRLERLRGLGCALGPVAVVAALHAAGRAESVAIVQSGGSAFWPAAARFTWPFLVLTTAGGAVAVWHRPGRVTLLVLGAIAAQTVALLVVARVSGADSPYMALKMPHMAIYPMAALGGLALSSAFGVVARLAESFVPGRRLTPGWANGAAWAAVAAGLVWTASNVAAMPRAVPAVSEDAYRAGRWAREHAQPDCVEYLVPEDSTSYWLHLAVLGNPSQPAPGAPAPVYTYRDAVIRWLTGTSHPVAIADLSVIPREIREDLDVLVRFGPIVVGRRRGATGCPSR
jgi:hypothetical protein